MTEVVTPSYTAVVLEPASRANLLSQFAEHIPAGWEKIAHHMTINLGGAEKGPAKHLLGERNEMVVTHIGSDHKVIAVRVQSTVPSTNTIKHITLAVNRAAGGRPADSNKLVDWTPVQYMPLHGLVAECGRGDVVLNRR